jgi:O-antigen/teichoic acid export membrane protein
MESQETYGRMKNISFVKRISRSSLIFKSGIAALDQAILSAVNFAVSIFLIKYATKSEYGYYSIAFSVLLIFISIQNAVVNAPLAVLLVTKKGASKRQYAGSLFFGQFLGIIIGVCLGIAGIALLSFFGLDSAKAYVAASVCIGAIGILFRDFLRAYSFAEEEPVQALRMDALYAALFLSLILLALAFFEIRSSIIFVFMGISGLAVGVVFTRNRNWHYQLQSVREGYRENWQYGKWALLGVLVTHTQNYSYLYLLGAMLGSAAVADVSAARLLLMPLALAEMGWSKVVIPHGSKLREQNQLNAFFKKQVLASMIFTLGIVAYVAFLQTFFEVLESFLLSDKYAKSRDYILLWGAFFIVRFITLNASYGLQVTKRFDTISKANFVTMLITVGCTYFLIKSYGIEGGLTALIIGGSLLGMALWFFFLKTVISTLREQASAGKKKELILNLSKLMD